MRTGSEGDLCQRVTRIVCEIGRYVKQPPTIFIIDDDSSVRSSLAVVLQVHGYAVQCFESAVEFLAEQDPSHVGCILIDLLTQKASGAQLLMWLHESGSLLSLAIISGLDAADLVRKEYDSFAVVEKPYQLSALLTMVADGVAGSLSRHAVRDRSRLRG
jgi:FixJ family two-component response regulator